MRSANLFNVLMALLCALIIQGCPLGEREELLILVRSDDPISKSLARIYAKKYAVPDHRILNLRLSHANLEDEIDAATFAAEFAAPIESYLVAEDPDRKISILLSTPGIPMRVQSCREKPSRSRLEPGCSSAALDAMLAGLGRLDFPDRPTEEGNGSERINGNPNPYFGDRRSFENFRRDEPTAKLRFLVARLPRPAKDGEPEATLWTRLRDLIVRKEATTFDSPDLWQLITHAPRGSRDTVSRALFDPIHDLMSHTGMGICDGCNESPNDPAPNGAIIQRTTTDSTANSLPDRFRFPGLVISLGPPASSPNPSPNPFQSGLERWISHGALAISMSLDDPTLYSVARPATQLRAWIEGRTAVEAHFLSLPQLAETNVFIGDPLLRTKHPVILETGDFDFDGIPDDQDNCVSVVNPEQRDSNNDGFGNRCDPDVDNDGRVSSSAGKIYPLDQRGDLEIIALTARNGPFNPDHDLDGDGQVDERDLALAQLWLYRRPGPSGLD